MKGAQEGKNQVLQHGGEGGGGLGGGVMVCGKMREWDVKNILEEAEGIWGRRIQALQSMERSHFL